MANLSLFFNRTKNQLMAGLSTSRTIEPSSVPFFYNDTLTLNCYILSEPAGYDPNDPSNSALTIESTAGRTFEFYLDDGTVGGTTYTFNISSWTADANNQYFTGALPLNTAALLTLIGSTSTPKPMWMKIGIVEGGATTTIYSGQTNLLVGLPTSAVATAPVGQTALSQEVARATYVPLQPVAGQPIYLESPLGKVFALLIQDNADGTASPVWSLVS